MKETRTTATTDTTVNTGGSLRDLGGLRARSEAYASFPFELPPNLRFDGVMEMGGIRLLQFTELDESSPSYGAGFSIRPGKLIEDTIAAIRASKRAQFAIAPDVVASAVSAEKPLSTIPLRRNAAAEPGAQPTPATPESESSPATVRPAIDGRVHVSPAAGLSSRVVASAVSAEEPDDFAELHGVYPATEIACPS